MKMDFGFQVDNKVKVVFFNKSLLQIALDQFASICKKIDQNTLS